jgi:TolA-binding protein
VEVGIMAKKIAISFSVLFCVVLTGLTFFLIAAEYSTDTISPLEQAKAYEAEGDYEQAEAIYRSIVTDYPGTDEAFQAQKNLALLFIATRNYSTAQAEVDVLIADFAEHPELPAAVYDIANHYWQRHSYGQAGGLYKYIADNVPDSNWAIVGQTWVASSDIWLGKYDTAHKEIDVLITDFAEHPGLSGAVYETSNQFWYAGRYGDARLAYQRVIEIAPDSDPAIWARAWVTGLELILGNSTSAQEVIDTVIADCNGHPGLTEMIYGIANGCWYVKKHEQAQQLYKYIADNISDTDFTMRAQAWVAGADLILGNYAAGQEGIDALIAEFPEHPQLLWTLNKIGWECGLSDQDPSAKYEQAKSLYRIVIQHYPNDAEASIAQLYTAIADVLLFSDLGDNTAAEEAIDSLITNFNDHPDFPKAISRVEEKFYNEILATEQHFSEDYIYPVMVWEKVTERFPDLFYDDPDLYYFIACCYYQLSEYENAIEYYSIVIDTWPDYRYALGAQRLTDVCFERLTNTAE